MLSTSTGGASVTCAVVTRVMGRRSQTCKLATFLCLIRNMMDTFKTLSFSTDAEVIH
jgi:hypothetical protein